MEPESKRQRCDGEPSVRNEVDVYPTPTSYLSGSEELRELSLIVKTSLNPSLTAEEYKEALDCPLQCNLRLKTALPGTPARGPEGLLPAVDACRLSSVVKARLQRWQKPTEEGRAELELQIAVRQEILDGAIRAIYERNLLVDSSNAESLLLVADYLQMEWLSRAVADFAEKRLLSQPSLGVCKLAAVHSGLGILERAVMKLMAASPEADAVVDLTLVANKNQRTIVFKAAGQLVEALEKRVDYVLSLHKHPEVGLTHQEAVLLMERPQLPDRLPRESWFRVSSEACYLCAWGKQYMQQKASVLTMKDKIKEPGNPGMLIWDIPLWEAKQTQRQIYSAANISTPDGSRVRLLTCEANGAVGLFVSPVVGALKRGGRFHLYAVGNLKGPPVEINVTRDDCTHGLGNVSLVTLFEKQSCNTICGGKYLPVLLRVIPSSA